MRLPYALRRAALPLAALLLAAATLALPVATVRWQAGQLLRTAWPRVDLGGLLWQPAVRQSPLLYALHRATLLTGRSPLEQMPEQTVEPETGIEMAAQKLDALHEADVLDDDTYHTLLAAARGTELAFYAEDGTFAALELLSAQGGRRLALRWQCGDGPVVGLDGSMEGRSLTEEQAATALDRWRACLGLEALPDWQAETTDWGDLTLTSAQAQVCLTASRDDGCFALRLLPLE